MRKRKISLETIIGRIRRIGNTPLLNEWEQTSGYYYSMDSFPQRCSEGHRLDLLLKVIWQCERTHTNGCKQCYGNAPLDPDFVYKILKNRGIIALSPYVNSREKMKLLCPNDHIFWMNYQTLEGKTKHGCPTCGYANRQNIGNPHSRETIENWLNNFEFKLNGAYINAKFRVPVICPNDHDTTVRFRGLDKKPSCPECNQNDQDQWYRDSAFTRIWESVNDCLIRLGYDCDWEQYYTEQELRTVSRHIQIIYNKRPANCHIDHIVPLSYFDLRYYDQLAYAWNIKNLRYLPAFQNIQRSNRANFQDVLDYPELVGSFIEAAFVPNDLLWEIVNKYDSIIN